MLKTIIEYCNTLEDCKKFRLDHVMKRIGDHHQEFKIQFFMIKDKLTKNILIMYKESIIRNLNILDVVNLQFFSS